jgi:UDP-N-acetylmuramoylalanine--D-glutamate ligase
MTLVLPGPGTRVLVWGFGRHGGGAAAARFCAARGAQVEILEQKPAAAFGLTHPPWPWHIGDGSHSALAQADLIVASPAIPPRAWPAQHPPRTSPEGLFCAAHRGRRVAVTGTKGKSTTAAILGSLLGWRVAGNSYEPLLDLLMVHGPEVPLVCELSSFQLWYLATHPPRFAGAVCTSLAVDHLDWHPDLAHYRASKLALFSWADVLAMAPETVHLAPPGAVHVQPVTIAEQRFLRAGEILASRGDLALLGAHNARNAALALALAAELAIPVEVLAARLRSVVSLPHRLEPIIGADGRQYYNDSIATTPESAIAALEALPAGPLAVILGGSDKGASFATLAAAVAARGAQAILIGSTAGRLAEALTGVGQTPIRAGTLPAAVAVARATIPAGGTILLSPACASFDQFDGFDHRGACFRALALSADASAPHAG